MRRSCPASQGHIHRAQIWRSCARNLKEVLELCLEEYAGPLDELPQVVGLEQIEVAV